MRKLLASASCLALTISANAALIIIDHGTGPPPSAVGPYSLTAPLPFDSRPEFTDVTDAPGLPFVPGDLTWDIPMSLRHVGSGWDTWSHGYDGVVYYSNGAQSVTMTMPTSTAVFLMYVQPYSSSRETFTVILDDGTSITRDIHGSAGAAGFGFYGTAGSTLETITVFGTSDFAWGEFWGHIPEPASLGLLGCAALLLMRRRRATT